MILARIATRWIVSSLLIPAASSQMTTKVNPHDGLVYVLIRPGSYSMGCSPGDGECFAWEMRSHPITIRKGFWLGQTEVTQQAYQRVTGANPSRYRGPRLPVDQIGWNDAGRYCEAVGMRLPTETEWEFAARGGDGGARYGPIDAVAWYDANSEDRTHEAGQKAPNAYGLFDMPGNVWEWVEDSYEKIPAKRLLRGGSFYNISRDLRVSNRLWAAPDTRHRNMGFRCAGN